MKSSTFALAAILLSVSASAATCTYTDGDWDLAPAENDDIVISSGDLTWDETLPLKVGSWTQAESYNGTVTFDTGLETFFVTGDVSLSGGTWTHQKNPEFSKTDEGWISGRGTKQLIVSVGGNMTISAAAKIDVTGCGFYNGDGPGSSSLHSSEGSGGSAHGGSSVTAKAPYRSSPCYGSARCPVTIGSGGLGNSVYGSCGGGAVRLTVVGCLTNDGFIYSRGGAIHPITKSANGYYAGSGGSVYITAGNIAGAGKINVDGGDVVNYCPGGGGRIAVHLTGPNASFEDCQWEMTAYSGKYAQSWYYPAFPGTIYLETAADDGKGVLICRDIDRSPTAILSYSNTNLGTGLNESDEFGEIRLSACTYLKIPSNVTVKVERITSENKAGNGNFGMASAGVWTNKVVLVGGTLEFPSDYVLSNYTIVVHAPESLVRIGDAQGNGDLKIADGGELQINTPVVWSGNIHVAKGGNISHIYASGMKKQLDLTVDGDLTVDEGGAIDVSGRGYPYASGPGVGTVDQCGASHGGRGHLGNASLGHTNGKCYGSIVSPVDCGSGGRWSLTDFKSAGGGSAKVTVTGIFTLNGIFSADGALDDHHTGSGGSAWILANKLTGAGMISANGGTAKNNTGVGGGGRVAVWLTGEDSTFEDFTGQITAYGGRRSKNDPLAAPGTVYLKTAAQDEHGGRLIIDNGPADKAVINTRIDADVTDAWVGDVFIASNVCFEISSNQTVKFSGNWTNKGRLLCADTSNVECVPASEPVVIAGTNVFSMFSCTAPGATLLFSPNESLFSIAPYGKLLVMGEEGNPLKLSSLYNSQSWFMNIDPAAAVDAKFLEVADSDASQGMLVIAKDSSGERCQNWNFVNVVAGETVVWTGAGGDGFWTNPLNWDRRRNPMDTDRIVIPAGCAIYPGFVEDFSCLSLNIEEGASLNLAGYDISVGSLMNAGSLVATSFERINVSGDFIFTETCSFESAYSTVSIRPEGDVVFKCAGEAFHKIDINLSGGAFLFDGDVNAHEFLLTVSAASAMSVSSGSEIKTRRLNVDGFVDGAASLTLSCALPSAAWNLSVRDSAFVSGVAVSGCDASRGISIVTESPSYDGGRNLNWKFISGVVKWTGAADGDFSNDANWSSGIKPGPEDVVVIEEAANIALTEEITVGELRLGGGEGAVSFTISSPLTVAGSMSVLTNATVIMNAATAIGGFLLIDAGGILTHSKNGSAEIYRINLEVGGNAYIAEGGKIDVKGCGYGKGKGPGAAGVQYSAGSHGGRGCGNSATYVTAPCYGSVFCPTNCGSSGSYHSSYGAPGGGAVKMTVAGELMIDGMIDAEGGDDIVPQEPNSASSCYYSGSGGSVWLTATKLVGYGLVSANGGMDIHSCCGGGGRIAVYLTESDDPAQTLSITCYGGRKYLKLGTTYPSAAPGSIYLQGCSEGDKAGRIIFDNGTPKAGCLSSSMKVTCDFPATKISDKVSAYRNAKLIIGPGAPVKTAFENKMRLKDVELQKGGVLYAVDNIMFIESLLHKNGIGWEGTLNLVDADDDGVAGDVRWLAPGLFIIVK